MILASFFFFLFVNKLTQTYCQTDCASVSSRGDTQQDYKIIVLLVVFARESCSDDVKGMSEQVALSL